MSILREILENYSKEYYIDIPNEKKFIEKIKGNKTLFWFECKDEDYDITADIEVSDLIKNNPNRVYFNDEKEIILKNIKVKNNDNEYIITKFFNKKELDKIDLAIHNLLGILSNGKNDLGNEIKINCKNIKIDL